MGCSESKQQSSSGATRVCSAPEGNWQKLGSIDLRVKHLRASLQYNKEKKIVELKKNTDELIKLFRAPTRSKQIEFAMIQDCTWRNNQIHIYEILTSYVKTIEQYKHLLLNPQNITQLTPAVANLMYAKQTIHFQELDSFCEMLFTKYLQLKKFVQSEESKASIVENELIDFYRKTRKPSSKLVNDFVLQFCSLSGTDINLVNASGNNFQYK